MHAPLLHTPPPPTAKQLAALHAECERCERSHSSLTSLKALVLAANNAATAALLQGQIDAAHERLELALSAVERAAHLRKLPRRQLELLEALSSATAAGLLVRAGRPSHALPAAAHALALEAAHANNPVGVRLVAAAAASAVGQHEAAARYAQRAVRAGVAQLQASPTTMRRRRRRPTPFWQAQAADGGNDGGGGGGGGGGWRRRLRSGDASPR